MYIQYLCDTFWHRCTCVKLINDYIYIIIIIIIYNNNYCHYIVAPERVRTLT